MDNHDASNKKKATVVFIPIPGMGHLMAMVELAKHLLLHSSTTYRDLELTITILNIQPISPNPQISSYNTSLSSLQPDITFIDLPKVELPARAPTAISPHPLVVLAEVVELHKPLVRNALKEVHASVAGFVIDFLCTDMVDVAKELDVPAYIFCTSGASSLGFMLHLPAVTPQLPAVDQYDGKTLSFPGFANPLPLMCMPEPLMSPDDMGVQVLDRFATWYPEATGILINTFAEFQPASMKALEEGLYHRKAQAVHAVGPILSLEFKANNSAATGSDGRHECIRWLDSQPQASVVFLCFGSMGSFHADQAREIAAGLERSGQRFLWVLRSPPAQAQKTSEQTQDASGHSSPGQTPVDAVLEEVLPKDFRECTRDRGMVWPSFAPQAEILAHAAIGGFVTHCGWNSCLESIWYGVPMAAWPLYAEQHLNAFEMVMEMEVAVEVRIDRKRGNAATAEEVERVVSVLMGQEEGAKVSERAAQMKSMARSAVHNGGSSFLVLQKFVRELIR